MISFKEFLLELKMDTKIFRDTDDFLIIDGFLSNDSKNTKLRFQANLDDPDEEYWMVTFVAIKNGLSTSARTDAGVQFGAKRFILSCMETLVSKHDPVGIIFSADTDEDDFGESRARVYEKLMNRTFKQYERVPMKQAPGHEHFFYIRKDS